MKNARLAVFAMVLAFVSPALAQPTIQVGFSPEGSARELALKVIRDATRSIQILAYSFQSPDITEALVDAAKRGVEVRVVVDKKRNLVNASKKALLFMTRNGIALRTNDRFNLHHDKTIITDGAIVATGSFNFVPSAETANSENIVVIAGAPEIADKFLAHWQSRWDLGRPYTE